MTEPLRVKWSLAAIWRMTRYGEWGVGWWGRGESHWGIGGTYYGGWYHALRLGRFGIYVYWGG